MSRNLKRSRSCYNHWNATGMPNGARNDLEQMSSDFRHFPLMRKRRVVSKRSTRRVYMVFATPLAAAFCPDNCSQGNVRQVGILFAALVVLIRNVSLEKCIGVVEPHDHIAFDTRRRLPFQKTKPSAVERGGFESPGTQRLSFARENRVSCR